MDKVRYTSVQIRLWEDRLFKLQVAEDILNHDNLFFDMKQPEETKKGVFSNTSINDLKADDPYIAKTDYKRKPS